MRFLWLVCAALLAAPAAADDFGVRKVFAFEAQQWAAVGRLTYRGKFVCTATLVTPDRIVTAAHCVISPVDGMDLEPGTLGFEAGWRDGSAVVTRRIEDVAMNPVYRSADRRGQIAADTAVLSLDAPIPAATVKPITVSTLPESEKRATVASYGRDREDAISVEESCRVERVGRDLYGLTCAGVPGTSGAPVLMRRPGAAPLLVGVMSAARDRSRPGVRTFAARSEVALDGLIEIDTGRATTGFRSVPGAKP